MSAGTGAVADVFQREHLVKIDGLREPAHAAAAAAAGVDLIGFIFAPARRRVTPETAAACIAAARAAAPSRSIAAVGVFVDASVEEICRVVADGKVDLVQLHGAEAPGMLERIPVPVLKALRPRPGVAAAAVLSDMARFDCALRPPAGFVIDGYSPDASGGTGARADWDVAAEIAAERPIVLGGGLDPENVGAAIRRVRPWGVDVSSGVEIEGVKDAARIEAFIRAARAGFLELDGVHP